MDVPRGHERGLARGGAQGRLPRARQGGQQDAGVERQEARRLRPHPGHPARAPAGRSHRLLPAARLDADHWQTVLEHGQLESAERALADGRIRHLGFSFHGLYEDFETIVAATDLWEFVQIQFNYMDEDYQAGRKGLELAAGKGLGVIVMEPVRGGAIAGNVPPQVQAVWDEAPVERSPAEWALRLGLERAGGVVPPQRHERHAPRGGEPRVRGPLASGAADAPTSSRWWRACATCTAS